MGDIFVNMIGSKMTNDEMKEYKKAMRARNIIGKLEHGSLSKATDNLISKLKEVNPKLICPESFCFCEQKKQKEEEFGGP